VQPAPEATARRYSERQVLVVAAGAMAARSWSQVDAANISASWTRQVLPLYVSVSTAQLAAAQGADVYVQSSLAAQGLAPAAEYAVAAGALAGVAADGRDLASLLYQPAITALTGLQSGRSVGEALSLGALQLDLIVRTEVADAGRVADGIATTTAPAATGYIRLVVGETCSRCIILAGRVYEWSQGFERHPRCDCIMVPVGDANPAELLQSPEAIFAAMTPEERSAAGWSRAEQQAIADGADIAAVTNVHRGGIYTAGGRKFTHEAAGRRPRITPEQIYREAGGDRAEAVRLLRLHKYIR
jgi:hypothetical protein